MEKETRQTTKDNIIAAARQLFAKNGYDTIGMRDVAEALSISVGNLTYHFKKKEDLLEAVILDFFNDYQPHPPCCTLDEIDALLQHLERIREENLFYFRSYSQVFRIHERLCTIQSQVYLDNQKTWEDTLCVLRDQGMIRAEDFSGQFGEIGNSIHFMKVYWNLRQEAEQRMHFPVSDFREAAWRLLVPLLTEEGKKVYNTMRKKEEVYCSDETIQSGGSIK